MVGFADRFGSWTFLADPANSGPVFATLYEAVRKLYPAVTSKIVSRNLKKLISLRRVEAARPLKGRGIVQGPPTDPRSTVSGLHVIAVQAALRYLNFDSLLGVEMPE